MKNNFPSLRFHYNDSSTRDVPTTDFRPLYLPVFYVKTAKGEEGLVNSSNFASMFGSATFDVNNKKYFCRDILAIRDTLKYSSAYIIRMTDESMKRASSKVVASIDFDTKLTKYTDTVMEEDESINAEYQPFTAPVDFITVGDEVVPTSTMMLGGNIYAYRFDDIGSRSLKISGAKVVSVHFHQNFDPGAESTINETIFESLKGISDPTIVMNDTMILSRRIPMIVVDGHTLVGFNGETGSAGTLLIETETAIFQGSDITLNEFSVAGKINIPLFAACGEFVGDYANELTYNLSAASVTENIVSSTGAWPMTIQYGEYPTPTSTIARINTVFGNPEMEFFTDSTVIDPATNTTRGFSDSNRIYFTKDAPSPVKASFYEGGVADYLKLMVLAALVNGIDSYVFERALIIALDSPAKLNVTKGLIYPEITFNHLTEGIQVLSSDAYCIKVFETSGWAVEDSTGSVNGLSTSQWIALSGGSNGVLDHHLNLATNDSINGSVDDSEIIEQHIRDFYTNFGTSKYVDMPRYPFNHIIDTGHRTLTKYAYLNVNNYRDDIKVVLSPWNGQTLPENYTEAISVQTMAQLVAQIRLTKACELYGTGAFRSTIFTQVGYIDPLVYTKLLPHTFWYNNKMAQYDNLDYIKKVIKGDDAEVEFFVSTTWTPAQDTARDLLWENCGNYCQYWSMKDLHYPSLRTVYENQTGLYVNDSFVNKIIYLTQMMPEIYKSFAGDDGPTVEVYRQVIARITEEATYILNGFGTFTVTMGQNAIEAAKGFEHSIFFTLYADNGQRIWNCIFDAQRLTVTTSA